ncbi:double-strand break repair protein AddB [Devosia sp. PTR5]|uniref:Double-strand break repair protein AddB n=1 Tax=Devosia oryzisoli TaxID=2774138 RepID=A0A927FX07_9HYPH|nr:double-strand break repair protein AddB [Devosia oryzisoli]MBD8066373.1 double-strand break repair protein AddB [Devosia oryzisoli]
MSLFSIPPHVPFLPALVEGVMDGRLLGGWAQSGPFWLSDVTIILPTQRARQALATAFSNHPGFVGLLPDIRTFGGDEADEEPFLPPFEAPPLPKATSRLERRMTLSHLVAGWAGTEAGRQAFATPPTAAEIFGMAEALGTLIDDLLIEERSAGDIRAVGAEMGPELGNYWQQTLTFLDIALRAWPDQQGEGRADAAALRRLRLDRQAMAAPLLFGDRPVIAAGSTGSIPATARLLAAIARLPRGVVVLPGLDTTLDGDAHAALLDPSNNPQGHPQYGLAHLLRDLGAGPAQVETLGPATHPRTQLVRLALALTADTADWARHRFAPEGLDAALDGVSIIAARTEDEEARAIALLARAALEESKTVGIVTPDRNLARRIAAELARFDIFVDDAAGVPLFHSPAGRLARQILQVAAGGCAAVDVMALLRNRGALVGRDRSTIAKLADDIELGLLRGQRLAPGLEGLRRSLEANLSRSTERVARRLSADDGAAIGALLDELSAALAPLLTLVKAADLDGPALAEGLWAAMEAISDGAPLRGKDELRDWAKAVADLANRGHRFVPVAMDAVLNALMEGVSVRNRLERRQDIAIWGQLEARLMSPDVMILAALNEDKWPGPADPGPWLSRGMRIKAGLEPPERQQGLAAHDFAQAMGNATVILAYAQRLGGSPALPSRLLQRLDAFIGEEAAKLMRQHGQRWLSDAQRIDAVDRVASAGRPAPNPPAAQRPRRISVTEVETLMRSPYDLYAKYVLGLRPLDALGEEPDARERGTVVHAIFARFVAEGHDPAGVDALDRLMEIARAEFAALEAVGERKELWLRRFSSAAEQFLAFETERAQRVRHRHAEVNGSWLLPMAEPVRIEGRADRVDELIDGTLEIMDFKTGSPPAPAAMRAFEAPQMPVEALIAQAGGMAGVAAAPSSALTYVKIALGPDAFRPSRFATPDAMDLMDAAEEIGRRLQGHVELFLLRDTPMPARLLPLRTQRFAGAYDHLARVAEWTSVDDGEDPS